jgi:tRNA threonylcarbamoyladenosine modification (KEOPS) complex  Pcc1 subunit
MGAPSEKRAYPKRTATGRSRPVRGPREEGLSGAERLTAAPSGRRTDEVDCRVELTLEFSSAEEARRVAAAMEPDNEGFVSTRRVGNILIATVSANNVSSLLHTLDDYLVCLGVAAGVRNIGCDEGSNDPGMS